MALAVSALNDVKVYNLSAGKTLPQWIEQTKSGNARSLRYNQEFRKRLELIHDFDFPVASTNVRVSSDGSFLAACGVYKPQVKVFELSQLGQKFERHLDADVVQFDILTQDYSKMAFLRSDRTVELHARWGALHSVRIPKFGRDMAYHSGNCDLNIVGASNEVYRLNLEQGSFVAGYQTGIEALNAVAINPRHHLLATGGTSAALECWDSRDKSRAAVFNVAESLAHSNSRLCEELSGCDITALEFAEDGLGFAVGTSTGHVLLYDLRSAAPLIVKDHRFGDAIRDIKFHESSGQILSTDSRTIKIWKRNSGDLFTTIQPTCRLHNLCVFPSTGLIVASGEQTRVPTFYIPELGPAPSWCSFLDNLTEELEEQNATGTAYDDYKFVTREELSSMGLNHLMGTPVLRPYMHGFFMDIRLWNKVKAVSDPFEYENYIRKRVQEKIEEQRAERITVFRKLPKVNAKYAEVLLQQPKQAQAIQEASQQKDIDKAEAALAKAAANPLGDDRFSRMFTDAEFAIDANNEEFERLKSSNDKLVQSVRTDNFELVSESDSGDDNSLSAGSLGEDTEEEDEALSKRMTRKSKMFQASKDVAPALTGRDVAKGGPNAQALRKISLEERLKFMKSEKRHASDSQAWHRDEAVVHEGPGSRSIQFVPRHTGESITGEVATPKSSKFKNSGGYHRRIRRRA